MTTVLPVLAAAALPDRTGVLVGRRRGRLVHVAAPGPRGLTPGGRLRRTVRPVCGQSAPTWPTADIDGRPLCARCARAMAPHLGARPADLAPRVSVAELVLTLQTCRDLPAANAAKLAVICHPRLAQLTREVQRCFRRLEGGPVLTDGERIAAYRPASRFPRRSR